MSDAAAALELRDIHLPPPPSWWPPAPGWWLLAAMILVGVFFAVRWLRRRQRERGWRRRVLAELDRIASAPALAHDPVRLAAEVSQLLRRASRLVQPQAAALRDEAWLRFLDEQLPEKQREAAPFRTGAGRLLVDMPYRRPQAAAVAAADTHALLGLARNWLSGVIARSHGHA